MISSQRPPKGRGVAVEESRKNREEKAVQIRKDKRSERSNLLRNKQSGEASEEHEVAVSNCNF